MHQRLATVLTAALTALVLSGCGGQQPAADLTTTQPADPPPSAAPSASAPSSASASPSAEMPIRVPTTGLPSAQFCDAGETYLVKFPNLPRVRPPAGATSPSAPSMCVYTAVTGELTGAPAASLARGDLTGDSHELPMFKRLCANDPELVPGGVSSKAEWVLARGWSAWTATKDGARIAMLCTDEHRFSGSLMNVPGSTPEDALNLILAAID